MVPGIGNDGVALYLASHTDGDPVDEFLEDNARNRSPKGDGSGHGRGCAMDGFDDFLPAVLQQQDAHSQQAASDEERGECLVFAVPVVVVFIGGLAADAHEEDDNEIGEQVAQRVDGIGNHCRRMS